MRSISDVEQRIAQLREDMKPLQELYGLKSKTIEERYQEIQARKQAVSSIPKPRFKLPKL
jgi:flagellar motility protein MotE (MotC chaperone)